MSQKLKIGLLVMGLWLFLLSGIAQAQTPRPTPTVDPLITSTAIPGPTATPTIPPKTPTPTPVEGGVSGFRRGTIQGVVYEDIDGDGKCIGTGVSGEGPLAGVSIEFVSSDEQTVVNLQSGPDGIYGLVAAGYSYWAVTARPGPDWVVTSEETLYAPISEDNLVARDVNFCLQKAARAKVVLPASGAVGGAPILWGAALVGLALVVIGLGWQWRKRSSS